MATGRGKKSPEGDGHPLRGEGDDITKQSEEIEGGALKHDHKVHAFGKVNFGLLHQESGAFDPGLDYHEQKLLREHLSILYAHVTSKLEKANRSLIHGDFELVATGADWSDVLGSLAGITLEVDKTKERLGPGVHRFQSESGSLVLNLSINKQIDSDNALGHSGVPTTKHQRKLEENERLGAALEILENRELLREALLGGRGAVELEEAVIEVTKELRRLRRLAAKHTEEQNLTGSMPHLIQPASMSEIQSQREQEVYQLTKTQFFGSRKPSLKGLQAYLDKLHAQGTDLTGEQMRDLSGAINFWKEQLNARFFFQPPNKKPNGSPRRSRGAVECVLSHSSDKGKGTFRLRTAGKRKALYGRTAFPKLEIRARLT